MEMGILSFIRGIAKRKKKRYINLHEAHEIKKYKDYFKDKKY